MCSANAQGRSPEGAIEWRENEGEKVRKRWRASRRMLKGGMGGKERQRGGEGGSSQAALYPDRSPLHTNFLVKEEKMALNPEKSFFSSSRPVSPGMSGGEARLSSSSSGFLPLTHRSSPSPAIINTPASEYNEPRRDERASPEIKRDVD